MTNYKIFSLSSTFSLKICHCLCAHGRNFCLIAGFCFLITINIITIDNSILIHAQIPISVDPIDGYEFYPIPIDIHLGIIKIPTKEIVDDDAINNTESVIVGTGRHEVLNRIQTAFAREFESYGKLKESDIRPTDYETKQAWSRIRKHIKNTTIKN